MFLIIQNGHITPFISKYIHHPYQIVKSYEVDVSTIDIQNYQVIIILGGNQSVTQINQYPYLLNVVELIKTCLTIEKPILGICLGCQLIAYALGCQIKSSNQIKVGFDTKILGYHDIFRCHKDYIIPNESIIVDEYFEDIHYLYHYKNHVYGIQCHPDVIPECVRKYTNYKFNKEYGKINSLDIKIRNKNIIYFLLNKLY